jgi:hypothetical protein
VHLFAFVLYKEHCALQRGCCDRKIMTIISHSQ